MAAPVNIEAAVPREERAGNVAAVCCGFIFGLPQNRVMRPRATGSPLPQAEPADDLRMALLPSRLSCRGRPTSQNRTSRVILCCGDGAASFAKVPRCRQNRGCTQVDHSLPTEPSTAAPTQRGACRCLSVLSAMQNAGCQRRPLRGSIRRRQFGPPASLVPVWSAPGPPVRSAAHHQSHLPRSVNWAIDRGQLRDRSGTPTQAGDRI